MGFAEECADNIRKLLYKIILIKQGNKETIAKKFHFLLNIQALFEHPYSVHVAFEDQSKNGKTRTHNLSCFF